jgi:hypothetical protein
MDGRHDKISSNIHPLILSSQLLKLDTDHPHLLVEERCLRSTKLHAAMPWTTPSQRLYQANLPQLHTANFVGFAPTLHDDDGLSPPPSPCSGITPPSPCSGITPPSPITASRRRLLTAASHRNRPPAASRRKQPSPRAADLQLTWGPLCHHRRLGSAGSDTNCWRCISQRLFFYLYLSTLLSRGFTQGHRS